MPELFQKMKDLCYEFKMNQGKPKKYVYWSHSATGQFLGVNINSAHIYARATIFMFALFALAHSSSTVADSHPPCIYAMSGN